MGYVNVLLQYVICLLLPELDILEPAETEVAYYVLIYLAKVLLHANCYGVNIIVSLLA